MHTCISCLYLSPENEEGHCFMSCGQGRGHKAQGQPIGNTAQVPVPPKYEGCFE